MRNYELVVIGGGPAGITLSKMLGKKIRMAVIRPEDYSMIYCVMPYAIEGLIPIEKTRKKDELVTEAGAELLRDTVTKVDLEKRELDLLGGDKVSYEKLVIATGATPLIPQLPGRELKGVLGFKTERDLKEIMGYLDAGTQSAMVVGAGAIGVELALALKARGAEVHLVDMEGSILPNLVDQDMAEETFEELTRTGIHTHLGRRVVRLEGNGSVTGVTLENGQTIYLADGEEMPGLEGMAPPAIVIFAVGMDPALSLFGNSDLLRGATGIIVNENMETNLPGVYAVGDCVEFTSGITGKVILGKLATNAVPMARVLGHNLLGKKRAYQGYFNGAATKIGRFYIGGTGFTEKEAAKAGFEVVCGYGEVTTMFPILPEAKKIRMKLVVDRKSRGLLGAQIVSGEPVSTNIDLLTFAIQKKSTVEDLAQLSYSAQPFQSFFPASNINVMAAEDAVKKMG